MKNAKLIGRLGLLTVGVGIGAAVAQTPIASADSPTDWLSSIDSLAGGALPAAPSSGLDLAISFDGYSLFHDGSAVADTGLAGNGNFDFAIAYGDGAIANAYGGIGDYALADGTNAFSNAGGGTGANFDNAIDIGNNDVPSSVYTNGAFAGDADLVGNYKRRYRQLRHRHRHRQQHRRRRYRLERPRRRLRRRRWPLLDNTGNGDHDTAIDFGNNSGDHDASLALAGNGNYASESGNTSGFGRRSLCGLGQRQHRHCRHGLHATTTTILRRLATTISSTPRTREHHRVQHDGDSNLPTSWTRSAPRPAKPLRGFGTGEF